jgi:phosphoribosylformylglycinamidine synthase
LDAERAAASLLAGAARAGLLDAAHDVSDGGLAVALAESCLAGGHGCRVSLPGDPFTFLFSESAARFVVAVTPGSEAEFAARCAAHGVPAAPLGTAGGDRQEVAGGFAVPLDELAATHQGVLPALFG